MNHIYTDERLKIRAWHWDDSRALTALANDPTLWQFLTEEFPNPFTSIHSLRFLESAIGCSAFVTSWALEMNKSLIGSIQLQPLPGGKGEKTALIGYWIGQSFRGEGFATDAVKALSRHAFFNLGIKTLVATTLKSNIPSQRVLEKCNYQLIPEPTLGSREGTPNTLLRYQLKN